MRRAQSFRRACGQFGIAVTAMRFFTFILPGLAILALCGSAVAGQVPASSSSKIVNEGTYPEIDDNIAEIFGFEPGGSADLKLPPKIPPPHFARYKYALPDIILKDKKEGFYLIPVPQLGLDPDTGLNFGAGISLFDNGRKDSPFFRITPYRMQLQATAIASTRDLLNVNLYYDQPYIFDTPFRVRSVFEVFYNPSKYYFGIGDAGMNLAYPGSDRVFGSYSDYSNALDQVVDGRTYSRYDEYGYTRIGIRPSVEYDLFGGLVRPLFGFQVSRVWIEDYTGNTVNNAIEEPTHLRDDCLSGAAIGCDGGFDNYVKFGISFDTRNFEPDPSKGIFFELVSELSPKFLGSAYNYGRLMTSLKAYATALKFKGQQIVLAGRFLYQWQFGDIPFYSMNNLAFTEQDWTGLGGLRTIHGYKLDRFIGPVGMLTNAQLRWSFAQFTVFKQYIKLMAVPFFDAGRVFDSVSATSFKDWKLAGGGGLHLSWNLSTVVSLDYGFCPEGNAFYMDLQHQF